MDLLTGALLPNKTGTQEQERVLQPRDHTSSLLKWRTCLAWKQETPTEMGSNPMTTSLGIIDDSKFRMYLTSWWAHYKHVLQNRTVSHLTGRVSQLQELPEHRVIPGISDYGSYAQQQWQTNESFWNTWKFSSEASSTVPACLIYNLSKDRLSWRCENESKRPIF